MLKNTRYKRGASTFYVEVTHANLYGFMTYSPSYQSAFQLSFKVLVRYRTLVSYLALEGIHLPIRITLPSNSTH
jgi:hypothetical protein